MHRLIRFLRPDHLTTRALTAATMASATANGVFYTVSALFFTRVAGLPATTVGLGLTIAGAVGVAGSFGAGRACDRFGARRVLLIATAGQALALLLYTGARETLSFTVIACAAVGLRAVQGTARQTLLAVAFPGPDRVAVRARLRVVTNIFIGLGAVLGGAALIVDSTYAYTTALVAVAVLSGLACLPIRALSTPEAVTLPRRAGEGSPLQDRRYLLVTGLNSLMAMQFGLSNVGLPLWVAFHTEAPTVTVSGLLLLNTVLVALLQVRVARGTDDVVTAARAVALAGVLLALACGLYAGAGWVGAAGAVILLVLAATVQAVAEMRGEAGSWGLAFELADPRRPGAYQGVSQTGYALGAMLAPLVITATAIDHGTVGWAVLAGMFVAAGGLTLLVVTSTPRPSSLVIRPTIAESA
ncbi:MFS transporter [Kineosporia sp. NBRC 101731]|uniref:MFS transporter n=1 Tax=Kineosporia sp. NBRC 101731 TaxID=3032199 RepID=UPI0024A29AD9|nr:MFS transporter [Kineosporia sp. NBRC 101731]GLY33333.1 MFS transporter [Kineosporia sp. NBRC 101731]